MHSEGSNQRGGVQSIGGLPAHHRYTKVATFGISFLFTLRPMVEEDLCLQDKRVGRAHADCGVGYPQVKHL